MNSIHETAPQIRQMIYSLHRIDRQMEQAGATNDLARTRLEDLLANESSDLQSALKETSTALSRIAEG